jgi:hypothetical protein
MVQIEAPPGWTPPAADVEDISTEAASGLSAVTPSAAPQAARPKQKIPSAPAGTASSEPLLPPQPIVAPHEARLRLWILVGGGLAAAAIVAFGLWTTFAGRTDSNDHALAPTAEPTATSLAGRLKPRPPKSSATAATAISPATSTMPTAAAAIPAVASATSPALTPPAAGTPIASATASPMALASASGGLAVPAASGTSPPAAVASASAVPQPAPAALAGGTAPPVPAASGSSELRVVSKSPGTAAPQPLLPETPPPVVPPPSIDLAARLRDKLPGVAFEQTSLAAAVGLISQLSTIRINYDWDAPAIAVLRPQDPVSLKLDDVTVAEAIDRLLGERKLRAVAVGDQLLVTGPAEEPQTKVDHPIDDLAGKKTESLEELLGLVYLYVAPETWDAVGGKGTIAASGGAFHVTQSPKVQRELAAFLDRLRKARGLTPRDPATTLDTRLDRAAEVLQKPVTMNFRPGVPLEQVLARLTAVSGATFTVDSLSLAAQGFDPREPIGCSADQHAVGRVLAALCAPREWAWRVVNERVVEITSRDALRRRFYVEFYSLPATAAGEETTGPGWATKIRTQLGDESWRDVGGRGAVLYDEVSRRLIVLQHQEAHQRIAHLLAEASGSAPPVFAPKKPSPTSTASGTAKPAVPRASATGGTSAIPAR